MVDAPVVLIVDDHWVSAAGLSSLIVAAIPDATCVISTSISDAIHRLSDLDSDELLIVADFWLPDGTALSLLQQLQEHSRNCRVIVLSGDDNPEIIRKVAGAGAWAFRSKASSEGDLLGLIRQAIDHAESPLLTETHAISAESPPPGTSLAPLLAMSPQELGLTRRQADVLRQVLAGRPNKIIARNLGIGEQTVKDHVSTLLSHFMLENRVALIRHFAERRIFVSGRDNENPIE